LAAYAVEAELIGYDGIPPLHGSRSTSCVSAAKNVPGRARASPADRRGVLDRGRRHARHLPPPTGLRKIAPDVTLTQLERPSRAASDVPLAG